MNHSIIRCGSYFTDSMANFRHIFPALLWLLISCNNKKKEEVPTLFLSAKEVVRFNQLVYKENMLEIFGVNAPEYEVVFLPHPVNGNFAFIAHRKNSRQYALVIRGSLIEFSKEGFQNFILQDFNIFTIRSWNFTDTIKQAKISNGTWTGFQNLLQLKDKVKGLSIKDYILREIPAGSSIVITGHSLGGNLAYPMAGYLKKELPKGKKENLQLITFGAPAAGNAAFVQDLEEKYPIAERYSTNKDIATVFPDMDRIHEIAGITGLDSIVNLGSLSLSGITKKLETGELLDIAGKIMEATNVINPTNRYVQSQQHLRQLMYTDSAVSASPLSVEGIFQNVYQFHRIDTYAKLLGVKELL